MSLMGNTGQAGASVLACSHFAEWLACTQRCNRIASLQRNLTDTNIGFLKWRECR